jgi:hemin uptake protein HemP
MFAHSKPTSKESGIRPNRSENADKRLTSAALFGETNVILIHHAGDTYTLRKTRNDKLILTK